MSHKLKLLSVNSWTSWAQLPGASPRRNVVHLAKGITCALGGESESSVQSGFENELSLLDVPHKMGLSSFSVVTQKAEVPNEVAVKSKELGAGEGALSGLEDILFILDGRTLFVADRMDSNVQGGGFLANVLKALSGQNCPAEQFHLTWPPFDCVGLPAQDEKHFVMTLSRLITECTKGVTLSSIVTFGPNVRKLFDLLTSEKGLHMAGSQWPKLIELPSVDSIVLSEVKKKEVWDALKFMRLKDSAQA